jgi:hypothetical protein
MSTPNRKKIIQDNITKFYKKKRQAEIISKNYKNQYKLDAQVRKYSKLAKEHVIYRIIHSLADRATKVLTKINVARQMTHIELIGCSAEELEEHLKNKFTDDMSFENYGEWEVDHIKPISKYNLLNENEMIECFNYKNLQPLWKHDNRKKSNKIENPNTNKIQYN